MKADLHDALAEWDRDGYAAKLSTSIAQRDRIVEAFPADRWPELQLEDYALGLDRDDTYSYLLEFASRDIGSIRGGSARKLLIYKQKTKPGWYFDSRFSNEHEAWEAIRSGFVDLLSLAAEGRFDEIDEIEALRGGPVVRGKTTWVYFPDQLLPIYAEVHLDHFLDLFDVDAGSAGAVGKNRRLFEALTSMPAFEGWTPLEVMFFLYEWASPSAGRQIVKIAPGEQARLWDDCRDGGFICVGWDDVGDLTEFPDKASYRERFGDAYPSTAGHETRKANELWTLMELEPGDLVIANRGTSTVVGIGRVNDVGYAYRPDREEYRHTLGVDWTDTDERDIEPVRSWATVTVAPVKPELYRSIIDDADEVELADVPPPDPIHELADELLSRRGQVIFYGPPGTGKTWTALRHAVWSLSEDPDADRALVDPEVFAECESWLTEPPEPRPVWLAVANPQNWKWSDLFLEGSVDFSVGKIAENYDEARRGDLVIGYQATPDKRIMALARVSDRYDQDDEDDPEAIWFQPVAAVDNGLTWDDLNQDPILAQSQPVKQRMQGTLFRLEPEEGAHLLEQLKERDPTLARVQSGTYEPTPNVTRVTFHPSYSYEDFVEGYKPTGDGVGLQLQLRDGLFKRICKTAADNPDEDYVLLIDEINRGNVPKIFGELITLLEMDKRELLVTLPQSGDEFFVPANVFIIGTMNTADRSIHLLDAALRRRFAFLELLPDAGLLAGGKVGSLELDAFLEELNGRIRERIGRDKQIGHALFLDEHGSPISSAATFALVFRFELLPLVQEYTFGDYGDLEHFFGPEVIDTVEERPNDELLDDPVSLVEALANHLRGG